VTDFRVYRFAWLPAFVAFVVLMFSFEPTPEPLEPTLVPSGFDGTRAESGARAVVEAGRERPPGSAGDSAVADLVSERFSAVGAGIVTEQTFDSSFEGSAVELRNVILTLPGESDRTVVVLAARDSTRPDGAVSSAAATGVLLELAGILGTSEHAKQVVLVSTDGGSAGAAGAREFAREAADPDAIDAAIVIGPPAAPEPGGNFVVRTSTGRDSASIQLVRTAQLAISEQASLDPALSGTFEELARLALPTGLGEQAVLIDEDVDAVGLSSTGERLPAASQDTLAELDSETLTSFGNAALASVLAVDGTAAPPVHGPETYVRFAGNLVPGWALAMLALTLILPAAVAAFDAIARAARRRAGAIPALGWAALLPLPLLAGLVILFLLALVGLVPDPAYPFDPDRFGFDAAAALALVVVVTTATTGYVATGIWRPPALPREVLAPALGVIAIVATALAWLLNPFLALLVAPVAHAWLLAAGERPGRGAIAVAVTVAIVPLTLAVAVVAAALDLGLEAPWQFLLMVTGGQIGPLTAACVCAWLASLAGLIVASVSEGAEQA
jgi:hypothetical protein